jgi:hypothetical protein
MQPSRGKRKISAAGPDKGTQLGLLGCWSGNNPGAVHDNKKSKSTQPALCPICNTSLPSDTALVNLHIDMCLSKVDSAKSAEEATTQLGDYFVDTLQIRPVAELPGLFVVQEFITEQEENDLLAFCDSNKYMDWKFSSFNGNCFSKYFGVRSQFGLGNEIRLVREIDAEKGEHDVPSELHPFIERLRQFITLHLLELNNEFRDFRPNECNINSYRSSEEHYLRPHFDDRTLSGPILMNLSLCGRAIMTFAKPLNPSLNTTAIAMGEFGHTVAVELPPRCLQLVSGAARWSYTHEIKPGHILDDRRVSITWRQAGGKKGIQSRAARPGEDVSSLLRRQLTSSSSSGSSVVRDTATNPGYSSTSGSGTYQQT